MKITVIICSHNPRTDHLGRTLDSLRAQTLPKQEWEFLLVDNASQTRLSELWDISWHPNGRHVAEPELGLAAARMRGMNEANADLLVFVDDDNVLDESYLWQALDIKHTWPILGAWGSGAIIPEFELEPADDLKGSMELLAIRQAFGPRWTNMYPCREATPWGAGLCVRAAVADAYRRMHRESEVVISGRRGDSLLSGEDNEIAYVACDLGLGMGVFPELRLTHLIPKERVSRKYLLRLAEANEASLVLLRYKWKGELPRSPLRPRGILSVLKHSILLRGIDRQMFFASIRGLISAQKIIADSQGKRGKTLARSGEHANRDQP